MGQTEKCPENEVDMSCACLSEKSLSTEWLSEEEDEAWEWLQNNEMT